MWMPSKTTQIEYRSKSPRCTSPSQIGLPIMAAPSTPLYRRRMVDTITGYVRVKVICIFGDGGRILAIDGGDPVTGERFWVPVGGGVELGETSREALIREIEEELSAELSDIALLGVLENIFTFKGEQGHEIMFVYDARFVDESMYQQSEIVGREAGRQLFSAYWIDPFDPPGNRPLYPDGLEGLLEESR